MRKRIGCFLGTVFLLVSLSGCSILSQFLEQSTEDVHSEVTDSKEETSEEMNSEEINSEEINSEGVNSEGEDTEETQSENDDSEDVKDTPNVDQQPEDEKPENQKPENERPKDEQPENEKPEDEKPEDEKPENERPKDEKPEDPEDSLIESIYISQYTQEENQLADAIIGKIITTKMSDFERVKAIHDYLVMQVDYDYQNYKTGKIPQMSHTAKGAFSNRYAVCDGYAHAFLILCRKAGISCEFVVGSALSIEGDKNVPHAWNQVNIEGQWYHVDVTWDDPVAINGKELAFDDHSANNYEYFCVPDRAIEATHVSSNAIYTCTAPALFEQALRAGIPWEEHVNYVEDEEGLTAHIKAEVKRGNMSPAFYIRETTIGSDMVRFFMRCITKAGIRYQGIRYTYTQYYDGTTDPGTFYRVVLEIQ